MSSNTESPYEAAVEIRDALDDLGKKLDRIADALAILATPIRAGIKVETPGETEARIQGYRERCEEEREQRLREAARG